MYVVSSITIRQSIMGILLADPTWDWSDSNREENRIQIWSLHNRIFNSVYYTEDHIDCYSYCYISLRFLKEVVLKIKTRLSILFCNQGLFLPTGFLCPMSNPSNQKISNTTMVNPNLVAKIWFFFVKHRIRARISIFSGGVLGARLSGVPGIREPNPCLSIHPAALSARDKRIIKLNERSKKRLLAISFCVFAYLHWP